MRADSVYVAILYACVKYTVIKGIELVVRDSTLINVIFSDNSACWAYFFQTQAHANWRARLFIEYVTGLEWVKRSSNAQYMLVLQNDALPGTVDDDE